MACTCATRRGVRRSLLAGAIAGLGDTLRNINGFDTMWPLQETSGAVADAVNVATALGRNIALLTYGDYTAGAGWSNPSGEEALHTAGNTATLQLDGVLAAGKTYQVKTTVSGRTVGSVTLTDGAAISTDGQNTQTITSSGTDLIYTPTNDFDGTIDVSLTLVQQTNILASTAYPGVELNTDSNALADPNGTEADATTGWSSTGGIISSDATIKSVGNYSLKLIVTGQAGRAFKQIGADWGLIAGVQYELSFDARHLGTGTDNNVRFALGSTDAIMSNVIVELTPSNTTFQTYTIVFTHDATTEYFLAREVGGNNDGGVYIDNLSLREVNPLNGDHTGVTVGTAGGGAIPYMATYDGATSYTDIYSAELNSKFNPAAGTLIAFARVANAGVWTDGIIRAIVEIFSDASNFVDIIRTATNNQLEFRYRAGGVTESVKDVSLAGDTGIFMVAMTWEKPGNMTAYINDVQVGTPQSIAGTWAGNLSSTQTVIGAVTNTPTFVWLGDVAYTTLYTTALTQPQIAQIYNAARI